ncbi:MAG: hypothetical protein ACR2K0_04910 [Acidimicrobiales bacterium]
MGVAGGAIAGVIPVPGGNADSAVIAQPAVEQVTTAVESTLNSMLSPPPAVTGVETAGDASVAAPTGTTSARASSDIAPETSSADVAVPTAVPTLPAQPEVPSCVADLIPSEGTMPDPAQLVSQLPACIISVVSDNLPLDTIQAAIGSADLPVDVSGCLASVVASLPTVVTDDLSALSGILSACLPTGSIPDMGSFPGMDSFPGAGSFPGFSVGR